MRLFQWVVIVYLLIGVTFSLVQESYRFATKTPYRFNKNLNTSNVTYPGCTPVKTWMFFRHGTRYPSATVIKAMNTKLLWLRDEIITNSQEGRGSLTNDEVKSLKQWKIKLDEKQQKKLAHEGEDEMVELAERYQKKFPELLADDYHNETIYFRHTASQRAYESARHFAIGLYGRKEANHVWFPKPIPRDPVLRFYKNCPKWKVEVDKNIDAVVERKFFENQPVFRTALQDISKHLGYQDTLPLDHIELMYLTCAFETAWNSFHDSPWCAAFTDDTIKAMEFREDLEYYWVDGYGYEINYQQACPAINDLINHFKDLESTEYKAVTYFSHSGAVLKILAFLGLFNDTIPFQHDHYHLLQNRKWRTTYIDCFASHIVFVLLQCEDRFYVLTYVQEREVKLPDCDLRCPLSRFIKLYGKYINTCDLSIFCHLEK